MSRQCDRCRATFKSSRTLTLHQKTCEDFKEESEKINDMKAEVSAVKAELFNVRVEHAEVPVTVALTVD